MQQSISVTSGSSSTTGGFKDTTAAATSRHSRSTTTRTGAGVGGSGDKVVGNFEVALVTAATTSATTIASIINPLYPNPNPSPNPTGRSSRAVTDYIVEKEKEETELDELLRNNTYRFIIHVTGLVAPKVSWDSTWAYKILFGLCWIARLFFLALAINFFNLTLSVRKVDSVVKQLALATDLFLLFQLCMLVFLFYIFGVKKDKKFELKYLVSQDEYKYRKEEKVWHLFKQSRNIYLFFLFADAIFFGAILNYGTTFEKPIPIYFMFFHMIQSFLYFVLVRKFGILELVLDDVLEDISKCKVHAWKYDTNRSYIDVHLDKMLNPFALYLLLLFLNCVAFVARLYISLTSKISLLGLTNLTGETYPPWVAVFSYICHYGIDIVFVFMLCQVITEVNEKSIKITEDVANIFPNTEDSVYIFQQQVVNPLVIKIFGILVIYKTQLLISLATYLISVIVPFLIRVL